MSMVRKFVSANVVADGALGDRQIRVVASDPTVDRVNDIMVPEGCILDGYKSNPIGLFNHDPGVPVGDAVPAVQNGRVEALITFGPKASLQRQTRSAGCISPACTQVSVGFDPIGMEPIEDGGIRYKKWELLELSCVSVLANPNAVTIARSGAAAQRRSHAVATRARPTTPRTETEFRRAAAINPKEQEEREYRQRCWPKGLAELTTSEEWDAYLAIQFPGLDRFDRRKKYQEKTKSVSRHDRFLDRVARSEWVRERRAYEALAPRNRPDTVVLNI